MDKYQYQYYNELIEHRMAPVRNDTELQVNSDFSIDDGFEIPF